MWVGKSVFKDGQYYNADSYFKGKADERAEMLMPYDVESIDDLIENVREKSVKDFAEWLPKHFDLRFAINPNVWIDEYFNHTSEKVLKEYKNDKAEQNP